MFKTMNKNMSVGSAKGNFIKREMFISTIDRYLFLFCKHKHNFVNIFKTFRF